MIPLEDLLHDLPEEYRERFELLLDQTAVPASVLQAEIDDYLATVRRVGPMVAFIDVGEAEKLAKATTGLVELLATDRDATTHAVVQAATRYFVEEEEDEEVTGVLGFDDDIQIVNAVCRAVGRSDLVIPLVRPPV